MIQNFLNFKGHQNTFSDSKITVILLMGWIWLMGGALAGEGLPCSLRSRLVYLSGQSDPLGRVGSKCRMDEELQHQPLCNSSTGRQHDHFPGVEPSSGRTLVPFFFVATLVASWSKRHGKILLGPKFCSGEVDHGKAVELHHSWVNSSPSKSSKPWKIVY